MLQYATEVNNQDFSGSRVNRFFPILANITFILYLFFAFFGTSLPFREKVQEVSDITTSNVVNQIAFSALFILSIIALMPKLKSAMAIIYREKIFFIFLMWGLLSIFWSDYNFVSFKRWFQYFTTFTVALSIMVHVDFSEVLIKRMVFLFQLYIVISLISIAIVPGAKDILGVWRGIAPSKNHMGQSVLLSLLVIFYSIWTTAGLKRILSVFIFMLGLVLLFGSQSMTSISTFLFISFLGTIFYIDSYIRRENIGRIITYVVIFSMMSIFIVTLVYAPDFIAAIAGSAGKDLTFTGRTDLWADILREAEKHWVIGAGFQGFWVVDNPYLLALYEIYVWFPNQAHNGYIDILNELGIIGLILFLGIILNYFRGMARLKLPHYWKWFVIVAIIVNIQESTFIRPQVVTGVMFLFSYFALFSDIQKKERSEYDEEQERLLQEEEESLGG